MHCTRKPYFDVMGYIKIFGYKWKTIVMLWAVEARKIEWGESAINRIVYEASKDNYENARAVLSENSTLEEQ